MSATMDTVFGWLRTVFAIYMYPAVIIVIFGFIVIEVIKAIVEQSASSVRLRLGVGAVLPFVLLILFSVTQSTSGADGFVRYMSGFSGTLQFGIGAAIGIAFLSIAHLLARLNADTGIALYVLLHSTFAAAILYAVIAGQMSSMNMLLAGIVLGAGLTIVFIGMPYD